jgi:hypothetical protein
VGTREAGDAGWYVHLATSQSHPIVHVRVYSDQERKDLLLWLGGFDCTVKHEEVSAQRQESTCTWVFGMKEFRQWNTPPTGQRGKFLWINGKRQYLCELSL